MAIVRHLCVIVLADDGDQIKFVLGPAGCGKTLTINTIGAHLQKLLAENQKFAGWHFVALDVQYTQTLPQFCKLLCQVLSIA